MVVYLQFGRPRFNLWVGKISWRRKWQLTPVFLPCESQGWRSLEGCHLWGCTESDTTEATQQQQQQQQLFPVVMYRCESWTTKKDEQPRIDAFELWCWRRLLRVPWTARRSNQSILKEINPEYSLEGLMLKLKLSILATWCEELTHWKRPWERLKAGGGGDDWGWRSWNASLIQHTWVWADSRRWRTGKPGVLQSVGSQSWTWLSDWTAAVRYLWYQN